MPDNNCGQKTLKATRGISNAVSSLLISPRIIQVDAHTHHCVLRCTSTILPSGGSIVIEPHKKALGQIDVNSARPSAQSGLLIGSTAIAYELLGGGPRKFARQT